MVVKTAYRILVVDDEPQVGQVLAKFLPRKLNTEIAVCLRGDEVLAKARAFRPDLILLDINLPGLMGWDVLREVRHHDLDTKVVMITANFEVPREDEELILAQTSGYLTKPVDPDSICAKIVEVLGEEALLSGL